MIRRNNLIQSKMSDEEYKLLKEASDLAGLRIASFVRAVLVEHIRSLNTGGLQNDE